MTAGRRVAREVVGCWLLVERRRDAVTREVYVTGHGTFHATEEAFDYWERRTRRALVERLTGIYEGAAMHGGKGDKKSHWRHYSKLDLVIIVADCCGVPEEYRKP